MPLQIPKATSFTVTFAAFLSSDHLTPATGKTIPITLSKAGGAFGAPNAGNPTNATEITSGFYKIALDSTDTNTAGVLAIRGTNAATDDVQIIAQVQDSAALLDVAAGVDTGLTVRQMLRLSAGALFGKMSGLGTTTVLVRNFADTKNSVTATVDSSGNRSAATYDLTT